MEDNGDTATADSLASSRSRRNRPDKHGRLAALQRLKGLKGSKHKYEVSDVSNVYEEVDEREYAKRRQNRLEDDWIIDDDGSGYVEDGREIFEDDNDDNDMFLSKKQKNKGGKSNKSGSGKSQESGQRSGSGNIRNMIKNMPVKKKVESQVRLDEDDVLGDILQDLNKPSSVMMPTPTLLKKKVNKPSPAGKSPVNPFSKPQITTPIRVKPVTKPRTLPQSSTIANTPSPKAKRNLIVEDTPPSQQIEEIDSEDLTGMSFDDDFDEIEMDDKMEIEQTQKPEEKEKERRKDEETKAKSVETEKVNRGFAAKPKVNEVEFTNGWETIKGEVTEAQPTLDVNIDSSQLPLTTNEEGEKVLRFYWLDAYEDYFKQPGIVYMFGKVWIAEAKSHVSCCITVKNIQRRIFILPRQKKMNLATKQESDEDVKMMDVYQEFNSKVADKHKILQFKSRKVTKKYCFEKVDVPEESEYLEVRYSADLPALPNDLKGETFSRIFGTNTNAMELLLMERRIKGPSWMDIKLPQLPSPPVSWCKIEAVATKPDHITPVSGSAPPPVVVMTLGMRTTVNTKTHQNEVAMVSCLIHHQFPLDKAPPQPPFQTHFCAVTHPSDTPWPWDLKDGLTRSRTKVEKSDTERALLGFLLAKIYKTDPDIVVGHDIFGFDLNVLLHRISINKIPHWSRLGRLKRTQMPKLTGKGFAERQAMCGRLMCDLKTSAKELIRAKSYDLAPLVCQVLRVPEEQCTSLTLDEVKKMYESCATLLHLISLTMQDTLYAMRLMCELNVLPLALQITNVAGNVMSRTLLGGRSERNEFLLLHAFNEKNFIVPDKQYGKANQKVAHNDADHDEDDNAGGGKQKGKKKPAYTGGLVLEPKRGFYDKYILLMDFNSLYPSIIQEYNICFTTLKWSQGEGDGDDAMLSLPEQGTEAGVLPTEIKKLVDSRRQVKNMMKQPDLSQDLKLQYDIRQKALKLTANSMYGCLGFSHSRFFARHLAALITGKGRDILLNTRDLVQKMNLDVIYGDTDSIMINSNCTDYDQVFKLGHKVKAEVNKLYKLLELDVDGVFKYMLLLKKKKYAALTVARLPSGQIVEEQELKGLDIVRRDWSQLASDCGKHIVSQILSDQEPDERLGNIHSHLEKLRKDLEEGKVPLDMLAITKSLTKNPEDYPDKKSLPHVQVALRIGSRGKKLRQGDTVAYVICQDGSNLGAMQRAYHVDEMKTNSVLTIDKNFYLANQIHPVVSRLCDPIDGTDAARIAECLGLDPSGYRASKHGGRDEEEDLGAAQMSEEERYRSCDRFTFTCPKADCTTIITMDSPFCGVGSGSNQDPVLLACPNPKCKHEIYNYTAPILNKLRLDIRKHILKYYDGWLICEDPGCSNRTRRIPLRFSRGFPICNACERGVLFREYTESQLYKQLCFYEYIFDFHKACQKNKSHFIRDENLRRAYNILHTEIQKTLKLNAYSEVNLTKLFANLLAKPQARGS